MRDVTDIASRRPYDWQLDTEEMVLMPRLVAEFMLARLLRDTSPLHPTAHNEAVAVLTDLLRRAERDWTPPHGIPRPRLN